MFTAWMVALALGGCDREPTPEPSAGGEDSEVASTGQVAAPTVVVSPEVVTFAPGCAEAVTVTVHNQGAADLHIVDARIRTLHEVFALGTITTDVIAPRAQASLTVSCDPAADRARATLSLRTNDPERAAVDVPLSIGDAPEPAALSLSEADARFTGVDQGELLGATLGSGDINGDGLADLLLGAPSSDAEGINGGRAYLVLGAPSVASRSMVEAHAWFAGEKGAWVGASFGVGDVDGDGYDDTWVGAPELSRGGNRAGGAALFRGPVSAGRLTLLEADATLIGATNDLLGASLAGLDVDGDGLSELVVSAGATGNGRGSVYILPGLQTGQLVAADVATATLRGWAPGQYAGVEVHGSEDVDGDGLSDLLVGAFGAGDGAGAVYVFSGPISGEVFTSAADATLLGEAGEAVHQSAGAGDVDGDGYNDVVVGIPAAGDEAGAVCLVRGGALEGEVALAEAHARLDGEGPDDYAGADVAGPGDVDGDGYAELLIGAHAAGSGGVAYLVHGPIEGSHSLGDARWKLTGEAAHDGAGAAVLGPGDVNGDGSPDLLVGARQLDGDLPDQGGAYLLLGGSLP